LGFGSKILGAGARASVDMKVGTKDTLTRERASLKEESKGLGPAPPFSHPPPKQTRKRPLQKFRIHIPRMMVIMRLLANIFLFFETGSH
jgi:hypothetical protein